MAVIYNTTMSPTKLELLAAWLPSQAWYLGGSARVPQLTKVGGFRLDDPAGEVGMEFMFVTDSGDADATTYHVPLTYRGSALDGAADALVGTSNHGVLGLRWIYDATRDPVLLAQLTALVRGEAEPQAQGDSFAADPTVLVRRVPTDEPMTVQVNRILEPGDTAPGVSATWLSPDGTRVRGMVVSVCADVDHVNLGHAPAR